MKLLRYKNNPILKPNKRNWWKSQAVFNPGAIHTAGQVYLLPRAIGEYENYISRLSLYVSTDGYNFQCVTDEPVFAPQEEYEKWGCEDSRITELEGRFYITYTALSRPVKHGGGPPRAAVATTMNFRSFRRYGILTPGRTDNKDTVIFPEKKDGKYVVLHRPHDWVGVKYGIDRPSIWMGYSDDLKSLYDHKVVMKPEQDWEASKIGAGPPPIKTREGWRDNSEDNLHIKPPVAIVEAQGYVYAAYSCVVSLLSNIKTNNNQTREEIIYRAEQLKKQFNQDFWMEREAYFALALDGVSKQRQVISSNPGHLLFTKIIENDKIDWVVNRLFKPDMWTPYGIRTYSTFSQDFDPYSYHLGSVWPHDNWIIYTGLQKLGYTQQAEQIKQALLSAYNSLNMIPEFYIVLDNPTNDLYLPTKNIAQVRANPLQAWSSAALLAMICE